MIKSQSNYGKADILRRRINAPFKVLSPRTSREVEVRSSHPTASMLLLRGPEGPINEEFASLLAYDDAQDTLLILDFGRWVKRHPATAVRRPAQS
jgi:hypothetical protein